MKQSDVPQDRSRAFDGERKGVYALDDKGQYHLVPSSGWDAEDTVLQQAIDQLSAQTERARQDVLANERSVLAYLMYANRMDESILAQSCGLFRWQVRRHFRPAVYQKLSARKLQAYAQAFGMSLEGLRQFRVPS